MDVTLHYPVRQKRKWWTAWSDSFDLCPSTLYYVMCHVTVSEVLRPHHVFPPPFSKRTTSNLTEREDREGGCEETPEREGGHKETLEREDMRTEGWRWRTGRWRVCRESTGSDQGTGKRTMLQVMNVNGVRCPICVLAAHWE